MSSHELYLWGIHFPGCKLVLISIMCCPDCCTFACGPKGQVSWELKAMLHVLHDAPSAVHLPPPACHLLIVWMHRHTDTYMHICWCEINRRIRAHQYVACNLSGLDAVPAACRLPPDASPLIGPGCEVKMLFRKWAKWAKWAPKASLNNREGWGWWGIMSCILLITWGINKQFSWACQGIFVKKKTLIVTVSGFSYLVYKSIYLREDIRNWC